MEANQTGSRRLTRRKQIKWGEANQTEINNDFPFLIFRIAGNLYILTTSSWNTERKGGDHVKFNVKKLETVATTATSDDEIVPWKEAKNQCL